MSHLGQKCPVLLRHRSFRPTPLRAHHEAAGTNLSQIDSSSNEGFSMLMNVQRKPPKIRSLRRWAIEVLTEAHAIRECEDHSWMRDRADPHARERANSIARQKPPTLQTQPRRAILARYLPARMRQCSNRVPPPKPHPPSPSKVCKPKEIAFLIVFLASAEARFVSGGTSRGTMASCRTDSRQVERRGPPHGKSLVCGDRSSP